MSLISSWSLQHSYRFGCDCSKSDLRWWQILPGSYPPTMKPACLRSLLTRRWSFWWRLSSQLLRSILQFHQEMEQCIIVDYWVVVAYFGFPSFVSLLIFSSANWGVIGRWVRVRVNTPTLHYNTALYCNTVNMTHYTDNNYSCVNGECFPNLTWLLRRTRDNACQYR